MTKEKPKLKDLTLGAYRPAEQEKRLADGTVLRLENPNAHYVEPKKPEKEKETE